MKSRISVAIVCLAVAFIGGVSALGQQGGFDPSMFDPAMIQKRVLEGYRGQLEIKDDAEWGIIEGRIQKVMDARRAVMPRLNGMGGLGGLAAMFGRGGNMGGPAREGGSSGAGSAAGGGTERQQRMSSMINQFLPQPSPEEEALKRAVEAKASKDEIKAALAKVNDARKQKQVELDKAREALREVLTVQQEAVATLNGLL